MSATKEQAIEAARALGYDPDTQAIFSIYADPNQIIVRRMELVDGHASMVEDVTIFNPDRVQPRQRADGDLGPLSSGEAPEPHDG